MIRLRGLTWDHARGRGPMPAVSRAFGDTPSGQGIEIEWDVQPLAGFESRGLESLCEQYDLLVIDHPHVGDAAASGCLLELEPVIDEYMGRTLASYVYDARLWAIPIDAACHVCAWHERAPDDLPRDWADVLDRAMGGTRIGLSLSGVHALMAWCTLLASQGTPLDEQHGWPDEAAMARVAELGRRLVSLADARSLTWNPIEALSALAEHSIDYIPLTFGYAEFARGEVRFGAPPTWTPDRPATAILGGTGLAVSASGTHPQLAARFARFAGSRDVQTHHWQRYGGQPAHRAAWKSLDTHGGFYRDTRDTQEAAFVRPRFAGWNPLQSRMGDTIHRWLADPTLSTIDLDRQLRADWTLSRNTRKPHHENHSDRLPRPARA